MIPPYQGGVTQSFAVEQIAKTLAASLQAPRGNRIGQIYRPRGLLAVELCDLGAPQALFAREGSIQYARTVIEFGSQVQGEAVSVADVVTPFDSHKGRSEQSDQLFLSHIVARGRV